MEKAIASQIATTLIKAIEADPTVAKDLAKLTNLISDIEKMFAPQLTAELEQFLADEEKKACSCFGKLFGKKK